MSPKRKTLDPKKKMSNISPNRSLCSRYKRPSKSPDKSIEIETKDSRILLRKKSLPTVEVPTKALLRRSARFKIPRMLKRIQIIKYIKDMPKSSRPLLLKKSLPTVEVPTKARLRRSAGFKIPLMLKRIQINNNIKDMSESSRPLLPKKSLPTVEVSTKARLRRSAGFKIPLMLKRIQIIKNIEDMPESSRPLLRKKSLPKVPISFRFKHPVVVTENNRNIQPEPVPSMSSSETSCSCSAKTKTSNQIKDTKEKHTSSKTLLCEKSLPKVVDNKPKPVPSTSYSEPSCSSSAKTKTSNQIEHIKMHASSKTLLHKKSLPKVVDNKPKPVPSTSYSEPSCSSSAKTKTSKYKVRSSRPLIRKKILPKVEDDLCIEMLRKTLETCTLSLDQRRHMMEIINGMRALNRRLIRRNCFVREFITEVEEEDEFYLPIRSKYNRRIPVPCMSSSEPSCSSSKTKTKAKTKTSKYDSYKVTRRLLKSHLNAYKLSPDYENLMKKRFNTGFQHEIPRGDRNIEIFTPEEEAKFREENPPIQHDMTYGDKTANVFMNIPGLEMDDVEEEIAQMKKEAAKTEKIKNKKYWLQRGSIF